MEAWIFFPVTYVPDRPLPQLWPVPASVYDRATGRAAFEHALEQMEYAEHLGFDGVDVAEPEGQPPPQADTAEEFTALFHAHPERVALRPLPDPARMGKTWPLVTRLLAPDRDPELQDAMRQLQVPVLVVFGVRDRAIPPAMGRIYKRLLPRCQLLLVYDAGHAVSTDRPEAFTEAVADFIARHEQYVVSRRSTVLFP